MSTDHNRIRVADLEKNQPDKILVTNKNGELEFNDVSSFQTESYNALDYTTDGKALDARQGKVLKDMINTINVSPPSLVNDLTTGGTSKALTAEMGKTLENTKLTASLATDAETQIAAVISEDKKVVSRLKLFNWWKWVKTQTQTISGAWNFTNQVTFTSSTANTPSIIIPQGILTAEPINGAIDSDDLGLYYCMKGVRRNLITEYIVNLYERSSLSVYIFGNGLVGKQSIITNLVTDQKLFKSINLQKDTYELSFYAVQSRWSSNISNAKIELQINISNSSQPSTWYTVSSFEDAAVNQSNNTLPYFISFKSTIGVQVLYDKYIFLSGLRSSFSSESTSKSKTENLKIANDIPLKQDMLVSFRLLTTLDVTTATTGQIFNTDYSLFQLSRK